MSDDSKFWSDMRAKLKGVQPKAPGELNIFEQVAKQREDIARIVAQGPRPVIFRLRRGGWAAVTTDASKPGRWRVTFLDKEAAPTGHIESATFEGAVKEAVREGADPGTVVSKPGAPHSIFSPSATECTPQAPNRGARYHAGTTELGTVQRRDGDHERYRCADCGAEWEA